MDRWHLPVGSDFETATDQVKDLKKEHDALIAKVKTDPFFLVTLRREGEARVQAKEEAQAQPLQDFMDGVIIHAKNGPDAERKYRGRKPAYSRQAFLLVQELLGIQKGTSAIAKEASLSRQTVLRIKADPAAADAALQRWNL